MAKKTKEKTIICNRIMTPDGTILVSRYKWECVTHTDLNGELYFTDGGRDYERRSINKSPFINLSIYAEDNFVHDTIRKNFYWGTFGISGNDPLEFVVLSKMSDEHIRNIIVTQNHIGPLNKSIFIEETKYRRRMNISIKDKKEKGFLKWLNK